MARNAKKKVQKGSPWLDDEGSGYEPTGFPALVKSHRRHMERIAEKFPRGGNPYDLSGTSDDD